MECASGVAPNSASWSRLTSVRSGTTVFMLSGGVVIYISGYREKGTNRFRRDSEDTPADQRTQSHDAAVASVVDATATSRTQLKKQLTRPARGVTEVVRRATAKDMNVRNWTD